EECELLLSELGNDSGIAWVTYLRGTTFSDEGRFNLASETLERAAALFGELEQRWETTNAQLALGSALIAADRPGEARRTLENALASAVELAATGSIMAALVLAASLRMRADPAAGTRLLASVRAHADKSGHELDPR